MLLGCAIALAALIGPALMARQTLIRAARKEPGVLAYAVISRRFDTWRARARAGAPLTGVVFGDSVFAGNQMRAQFPITFAADLDRRGIAADVLDLTFRGLSAAQFYGLTGRATAANPCFAVVEVNRRSFAADWLGTAGLSFPQLAIGLSLRQVARDRTALAVFDISPVAPLVLQAQEATGTMFVVDGLRRLAAEWFDGLGLLINDALGLSTRSDQERTARILTPNMILTADTAPAWYGQDFVATPSAAILRSVAAELRSAGVTTLFVVAPANLERLAELGVSRADLDQRTEQLRIYLGVPAPAWIDMSPFFQPPAFLDALHLQPAEIDRMAALAAARMAELLAAAPCPQGNRFGSRPADHGSSTAQQPGF